MRNLFVAVLALTSLSAAPPPRPESDETGTRLTVELDAGWRFTRSDVRDAANPELDDGAWDKVTLPHSFNAEDGERPDYYRGPTWYRRPFRIDRIEPGRRLFIQVDGAATSAQLFLNGQRLGRHDGGHAAFRFDLTPALRLGRNLLAVRVDNAADEAITPLGGDFTVFGGLYRGVSLLETDDIHLDLMDHGGPGVYARLLRFAGNAAHVAVTVRVTNDGTARRDVPLRTRVLDARGHVIAESQGFVSVEAGATTAETRQVIIPTAHRWDGVRDPYLYRLQVRLGKDGDAIVIPLGLREIAIDPEKGLLLNGCPYPVRGANLMASARPGKGTAVTPKEIDEDFRILREMGSTGVRLVHFQHGQEAYDMADRLGLVAWTEVGVNSKVADTPAFRANAVRQVRELIAQNYNHPSVALWGIGNEVYAEDPGVARTLEALNATVKAADPSRPTVYAHCCQADDAPKAMITDVIGFNRYFGWYPDQANKTLGGWAAGFHAAHPHRAFAIAEYGAGGSILHQEDPPRPVVPASGWHPEQFQANYHEQNWREIAAKPYIFATFVWTAFDLASGGRNEGDRRGINDKGLVSYDRRVRKDAWFWYQANWSDRPMVHIVGRRFRLRPSADNQVKLYTNRPTAELWVNGVSQGRRAVLGRVASWSVNLRTGENTLLARVPGTKGVWLTDSIGLNYAPLPRMLSASGQIADPIP
ncbi:glycoside hydrolase family 2 protein [Sphingomonas sp. So64.6b]|uniref:glycoside hydrolase family 2 protein n=1 Tax=Sphingomonas sp. So64.6b TaxID=2997354 RepID=UPI0015FF567E|nr:glycoside hydrolase family 2 TIM barrel-domain containing protein [Sphingomonas sp. So64.6b]QNA83537.1 glycoside hydrolase family 2 protein [Sphingomonas sp. So64.6b]